MTLEARDLQVPAGTGDEERSGENGQRHDADDRHGDPDASAVDLHNTVCPVSGDKVEDSKLTETYQGKIYHFCCDDCPKKFKEDPDKYAKAVAADPAKYGVK